MEKSKIRKNKILDWYKKYSYLHKLIGGLENEGEIGSTITSFMLNAQLIEYRLKKEINLLNHFINHEMIGDSHFSLSTKSVEEVEEEKVTLGSLIKKLDNYESEYLIKLKKTLKELIHYRNLFVHKLFNQGSLKGLEGSALEGNKIASNAWNQLEDLNFLTSGEYYREKYG